MAEQNLERIEQLLEEAIRWLRITAAPTIRSWLEPILTTTEERRVYQASTGATREEVAKAAGLSQGTVSNYWNRWRTADPPMIKEAERKGRYVRLYDLAEINVPIEVPSRD